MVGVFIEWIAIDNEVTESRFMMFLNETVIRHCVIFVEWLEYAIKYGKPTSSSTGADRDVALTWKWFTSIFQRCEMP